MNTVFFIKTLKKIVWVLPFLVFYVVFNNVLDFKNQLDSQDQNIEVAQNTLTKKQQNLTKLKKDYAEKLAFVEKHKFDLENGKQEIELILKKIDSSGYFKSSIVSMELSKKFINVGKYEITIETHFKNFTLQDFEDLLNAEARRLGKISPLKYIGNKQKSGVIKLFIKGNDDEK